MASSMYREIAEELRGQIEAGKFLLVVSCLPNSNSATSTARRGTPYGTRSSCLPLSASLRRGRGRVPSSSRRSTRSSPRCQESPRPASAAVRARGTNRRSKAGRESRRPARSGWRSRRPRLRSPRSWAGRRDCGYQPARKALPRRNSLVDADVLLPDGFRDARCAAAHLARGHHRGTVQYLADTLGVRQVGYRDWLAVRAPDSYETDFFRLSSDSLNSIVETPEPPLTGTVSRCGLPSPSIRRTGTSSSPTSDRSRSRRPPGRPDSPRHKRYCSGRTA